MDSIRLDVLEKMAETSEFEGIDNIHCYTNKELFHLVTLDELLKHLETVPNTSNRYLLSVQCCGRSHNSS